MFHSILSRRGARSWDRSCWFICSHESMLLMRMASSASVLEIVRCSIMLAFRRTQNPLGVWGWPHVYVSQFLVWSGTASTTVVVLSLTYHWISRCENANIKCDSMTRCWCPQQKYRTQHARGMTAVEAGSYRKWLRVLISFLRTSRLKHDWPNKVQFRVTSRHRFAQIEAQNWIPLHKFGGCSSGR